MSKSRVRALLLCLTLIVTACSDSSAPEGRSVQQGTLERGKTAFPVEVMEVKAQEVIEWISAIGPVSADKRVTVSAEVGGKVAEILVDVGDPVALGDLLAKLDDERSRIAKNLARAEVEKSQANLENSQREAQRQTALFEDNVASEHAIDNARLQANIDAEQLKVAKSNLANAERNLADAQIISPIDGEISRRHIEIGELVQPSMPLFDVLNIARVKLNVAISEREITRIYKGQEAEVRVDGYPDIVFHGTVNTISAEADSQTHAFPVEVLVINDRPERLLPGFIGRVRIRGRVFKNAIFLPEDIILQRDGKSVVFVAASEKVSARPVRTGFSYRGKVLISEGLNSGDTIVVTGQEPLQDGDRIRIR